MLLSDDSFVLHVSQKLLLIDMMFDQHTQAGAKGGLTGQKLCRHLIKKNGLKLFMQDLSLPQGTHTACCFVPISGRGKCIAGTRRTITRTRGRSKNVISFKPESFGERPEEIIIIIFKKKERRTGSITTRADDALSFFLDGKKSVMLFKIIKTFENHRGDHKCHEFRQYRRRDGGNEKRRRMHV